MNKSTFLLLPTVLAVSASTRTKSSSDESPRNRTNAKLNHEYAHTPAPKSATIDFVFTVNK